MASFIQVGSRVVNLDLVCGAERQSRGRLIVYLATAGGSGPAQWNFDNPDEVDALWRHLTASQPFEAPPLPTPMAIADRVINAYTMDPVGTGH